MVVEATEIWFESLGHQLWGCIERSPASCEEARTVVLSHGLTNHHGDAPLFDQVRDELLERGHDIFVFDYYGSGKSDGLYQDKTLSELRQNLADAIRVAASRSRTGSRTVVLFGRSVGGTLAGFHIKHPEVCAAVLLSAPFDLHATFAPTYSQPGPDGWIYLNPLYRPSGQLRGEYRLRPSFYYELVPLTEDLDRAACGGQGVLIMQGGEDEKVDETNARNMFERLGSPKKLDILDGIGHNYIGAESVVAARVAAWITQTGSVTI